MRKPRPAWAIAPASDRRRLAVRLPLNPSRRMDGNLHPRLILIDIVRASIDTDPPASPLQALELRRWALARFSCPGATAELEAAETLGAVTLSTWSLFQATERCGVVPSRQPRSPDPGSTGRDTKTGPIGGHGRAETDPRRPARSGTPQPPRARLEHTRPHHGGSHLSTGPDQRFAAASDALFLPFEQSRRSRAPRRELRRADQQRDDCGSECRGRGSADDSGGISKSSLQRSVSTLQLSPASPSRRPDTKRCRRRPLRSPSGSRFQNVAPPRSSAGT